MTAISAVGQAKFMTLHVIHTLRAQGITNVQVNMRTRLVLAGVAATALVAALPAAAATPTFNGTVGPGFTISMSKKPTKAGKIKLVVDDKSSIHNFHLSGPGVNVKTSVSSTGKKTFTITLKKGTYKFICDPHPFMKGSFTVR